MRQIPKVATIIKLQGQEVKNEGQNREIFSQGAHMCNMKALTLTIHEI
jgi:hypothetical protein